MNYQTIPLPNGKIEKGLFPTIDWFNRIAAHINFTDKTVLDIGCNNGSYCIQALNNGALHVEGREINKDFLRNFESYMGIWDFNPWQYTISVGDIGDKTLFRYYDIAIFSMVIYWIEDAPKVISRVLSHV